MTERCKHGMDARFCSLCNSAALSRSAPSGKLPPRKRTRARTPSARVRRYLDYRFANDGRSLVITADLAKGWRSTRKSPGAPPMKTFCFSEVADADWQAGTVHIQMSIFPRPGGLTEDWATPPDLVLSGKRGRQLLLGPGVESDWTGITGAEWVDECWTIQASGGVLFASVDLLTESHERPRLFYFRYNAAGDRMFQILDDYVVRGRPFIVNLQLRLTFKAPTKPAPLERSFWNDFLPGGRPESNRRKF